MKPMIRLEDGRVREMTWEEYFAWIMFPTHNIVAREGGRKRRGRTATTTRSAKEEEDSEIAALRDALIWCSGLDDVQEGGKARRGWLKVCKPLLDRIPVPLSPVEVEKP